jgi:hypothetical protein
MSEMAAQTLYEAVLAKVQVGSKGVRPTAREVVFFWYMALEIIKF